MILAHLSWPEIEFARSRVCVVPLGALEQHGPHLPMGTDAAIASAIAERVEQQLPDDVLLARCRRSDIHRIMRISVA